MKRWKEGLLILFVILMAVSVVYAGIMNRNVETNANIASSKLDLTAVAITGGSILGTTAGVVVVDKATSDTIAGYKVTTNYGATTSRTFTLPTAVAGMVIDVLHTDTDNLKVVASGSDLILGTTNNSLVVTSGAVGSSLRLISPRALSWVISGREGTWADTTTLP